MTGSRWYWYEFARDSAGHQSTASNGYAGASIVNVAAGNDRSLSDNNGK